jgi:hypothetical protein
MGPAPICFHVGSPISTILFGETENAIPLEQGDHAQPATYPLLTHMHIIAIADDNAPKFPWPIMVYNRIGIKCWNMFYAIYENFQQHVMQREFESWSLRRQEQCSRAYFARNSMALSDLGGVQPHDGLR